MTEESFNRMRLGNALESAKLLFEQDQMTKLRITLVDCLKLAKEIQKHEFDCSSFYSNYCDCDKEEGFNKQGLEE